MKQGSTQEMCYSANVCLAQSSRQYIKDPDVLGLIPTEDFFFFFFAEFVLLFTL